MKKKRILCLLILALCTSPAWGAIAFVSGTGTPHKTTTATSSTSCALTYTPNAAGDALVVGFSAATTTVSSVSVSDNATGGTSTYTSAGSVANGTNIITFAFYTASVNAGVTTITVSWITGSRNSCDVAEYSGVGSIGISKTGTSSGSSALTITQTTDTTNAWMVMAAGTRGTATYSPGTTSCAPTNPCTLEDSIAGGGSTTTGIAIEDDGNATSSGTNYATQLTASAAGPFAGVQLELKPGTSPPPPTCTTYTALTGAGCQ